MFRYEGQNFLLTNNNSAAFESIPRDHYPQRSHGFLPSSLCSLVTYRHILCRTRLNTDLLDTFY